MLTVNWAERVRRAFAGSVEPEEKVIEKPKEMEDVMSFEETLRVMREWYDRICGSRARELIRQRRNRRSA